MYVARWPSNDYEGELELVARFHLGCIAQDRHDAETAREYFRRIIASGSRNPANLIIAETRSRLRRMDASEAP